MAVRNCADIGENLQKITTRLLQNQRLLKLLYYTGNNPFDCDDIPLNIINTKIKGKLIKIVPKLDPTEVDYSTIGIMARSGSRLDSNTEFKNVIITIEVFVPVTKWMIHDTNLRPYAILGEIQKSLDGLTINGLGKMIGGDFEYNFGTDEMSGFLQTFYITAYD